MTTKNVFTGHKTLHAYTRGHGCKINEVAVVPIISGCYLKNCI